VLETVDEIARGHLVAAALPGACGACRGRPRVSRGPFDLARSILSPPRDGLPAIGGANEGGRRVALEQRAGSVHAHEARAPRAAGPMTRAPSRATQYHLAEAS
jgi:hypothetical protein